MVPHWCTYSCPIHCSICMDKVKISFQCITYLLLISNCNMHWVKNIRCKISIRQVLTFRGLLSSLLWILWTILYHCYFSSQLAFQLAISSFWSTRFPKLLRNVVSHTEKGPLRERQISRRRYRQEAMATENVTATLL